MDDVLLSYEALVRSVVLKYNFLGEYDDLYQSGMMGLSMAFKNYNEKCGADFSSYAYFYIKGEILKTLNNNYLVHMSKDSYKLFKDIKEMKDYLRQTLNREPTVDEIGFTLNLSCEDVNNILNAFMPVFSLDDNTSLESDNLYNKIAVIEKGYNSGVLDLKNALNYISESEKELITSRYFQDLTQSETAKKLGLSQVQVSRKETKILEKLKVIIS